MFVDRKKENPQRENMRGNSCEFFKVYLSQPSSKQLGLPPAFVHQLGGKVPNNCTIKDPSGKIWRVELEGANVGLVIANGWQEFASHHSLVDGDFLIFDYNGDSQFGVQIYGINGLRKRKASDECESGRHAKKERREEVEARSRSLPTRSQPTKLRPDRGNEMRNLAMPPRRFSRTPAGRSTSAKSKSMANPTSAINKRQQGEKEPSSSLPTRPWPARLRPRNLQVPIPGGGESAGANSKLKVNHTSHIKKEIQQEDQAPSSSLPVRPRPLGLRPNSGYKMRNLTVPNPGGKSTRADVQTSSLPIRPLPPGLRPNRAYETRNTQTPLKRCSTSPGGARSKPKADPTSKPEDTANKESATKHDECRSANLMVFDPPKNPHFATRITLSTKHQLYVPRSKVQAFKIELGKIITLVTDGRKRWEVETVRRGKKRDILLRSGWQQFVADNNLLFGDWCVFEMVPTGAKRISELLVHIQRSGNRRQSSTEKPQKVPKVVPKLEEE